ncbi:MAG: CBS domain-containing protein [Bacteroidia bacterium]|nr:CBS domain-containing protein [Bacteroidia bacterium]
MYAKSLLSLNLPTLHPEDSARTMVRKFATSGQRWLPIVHNDHHFQGIVSRKTLRLNQISTLKDLNPSDILKIFVSPNTHIFDIIQIMGNSGTDCVPVLSQENNYLGLVIAKNIIQFQAENTFSHDGGIIVLEMERYDFSLGEIARLTESENAKILSLLVTNVPESRRIWVSIKLSMADISRVITVLERFGYQISSTSVNQKQLLDTRDIYDSFMRYLNI